MQHLKMQTPDIANANVEKKADIKEEDNRKQKLICNTETNESEAEKLRMNENQNE